MKDTRQKILATALELFNQRGVSEITLRNIAQKMGISQGNLNYYFKLKEEIVETLYFDLVQKLDAQLLELAAKIGTLSPLEMLYRSSFITMQQLYDYRFILVDFLKIMTDNQKIKTHYVDLQVKRKQEFLYFFQVLIETGTLRAPEFEQEYERMYERLHILGDSWINAYIMFGNEHVKNINYYQSILFELIYPYLTAKGKEEFWRITKQL